VVGGLTLRCDRALRASSGRDRSAERDPAVRGRGDYRPRGGRGILEGVARRTRTQLGQQLLAARLIHQEQLDAALAMQGQFGGRLGTNLIELGAIKVDPLAEQLGLQLGVPVAVKEHFVRADRELFQKFPGKLAAKHGVVPLGWVTGRPKTMSVAMIDPLDLAVIDELALVLGAQLDVRVAPEARIQYVVEKVWGIRPQRRTFIRMDFDPRQLQRAYARAHRADAGQPGAGRTVTAPPSPRARSARPGKPGRAPLPTHLEPPPLPILDTAAARPAEPAPPTRRVTAPRTPSLAEPSSRAWPPRLDPASADARPRREAVLLRNVPDLRAAPAGAAAVATGSPPAAVATSLERTLQAIADTPGRDAVAGAVVDYLCATYGCGLLLSVKNDLALGWRGRFPGVDAATIEALILPLGAPSVFATAFKTGRPFRGPPPASGEVLHERLWKLLRAEPPAELLVVPIALGARVVQLLYVHAPDALPKAAGPDVAELAKAAAEAYRRLIQHQRAE
jgi:hypothetical protein